MLSVRDDMPTTAAYIKETGIVELTYAGTVSPEELVATAKAAAALLLENGARRCLADCTALEGGHSFSDLYWLVDILDGIGVPRPIREAILVPPGSGAVRDKVSFYENAAVNRGYDIRLFEDRAAAVAWLGEKL